MLNTVTIRSPKRLRAARAAFMAALALTFAACAPRETDPGRATAATPVTSVTFYPAQAGQTWTYLPQGEPLNSPAYSLSVLGPTLFGEQQAVAYRFTGRGADQTSYRIVSDAGVQLLGFTKPGLTVTLSPAWQEYPPASAWKAGLAWGGETTLRVVQDGKVVQEGKLQYRYTVLEKRRVSVGNESLDVWVVTRQINDNAAGLFSAAAEELWFAPYLGEVRTPEGLLQISRNYKGG